MELHILGTGSALPTINRNHSATALDIGPEVLLFDCGEGTQLQLAKAKISTNKISKIFITHWHGDHVLGLPGLLQTMQLSKRTKPLDIYGPKETKKRFGHFVDALSLGTEYKINIIELKPGAFNSKKYSIIVANAAHTRPCLTYAYQEKPKVKINVNYIKKFGLINNPLIGELVKGKNVTWKNKTIRAKDATFIEKGKKFVYLLDSAYSKHLENFCKDADVLLCEATFAEDMKEFAKEFGHMTAGQAATLAKKSGTKKLIITHFSNRYKDSNILLKEAKKVFANTIAAKDLMVVEI